MGRKPGTGTYLLALIKISPLFRRFWSLRGFCIAGRSGGATRRLHPIRSLAQPFILAFPIIPASFATTALAAAASITGTTMHRRGLGRGSRPCSSPRGTAGLSLSRDDAEACRVFNNGFGGMQTVGVWSAELLTRGLNCEAIRF